MPQFSQALGATRAKAAGLTTVEQPLQAKGAAGRLLIRRIDEGSSGADRAWRSCCPRPCTCAHRPRPCDLDRPVLRLPEPQCAEQTGLVVGIGRRLDSRREDAPLTPLVGVRGDVLVHPSMSSGRGGMGCRTPWQSTTLGMRGTSRGARSPRRRVVAVGEAKGVGEVARPHRGGGLSLRASYEAIGSSPSRSTSASGSPSAAACPRSRRAPTLRRRHGGPGCRAAWGLELAPLLRHGCREVGRIDLIDDLAERGVGVEEESGGAHEWGGYSGWEWGP